MRSGDQASDPKLRRRTLAGAALVMFGLFAQLGDDLGLVVVGPLFELS